MAKYQVQMHEILEDGTDVLLYPMNTALDVLVGKLSTGSLTLPGNSSDEILAQTLANIKKYLTNLSTVASQKRGVSDSTTSTSDIDLATSKAVNDLKVRIDSNSEMIATHSTQISGKAPNNHASNALTYGGATGTLYGHVMLSDTYSTQVTNGAAANSIGASQNALYNAYNALNVSKAPNSHAVNNNTYGIGTSSLYGHVKLSDVYSSKATNGGAADGLAASQNALYGAYSTLKDVNDRQQIAIDGKSPTQHASTSAETYGAGTGSRYGHVRLSDAYDIDNSGTGAAANSIGASSWSVYRAYSSLSVICNTKLAATHADEKATATKFSHVKLSDGYTENGGAASAGVGASSLALYNAYTNLNARLTSAQSSIYTLNGYFDSDKNVTFPAKVTATSSFQTVTSSTTGTGTGSCAFGYQTLASGVHSHTEGSYTTTSNIGAHAEGYRTSASGEYSHAEGYNTSTSMTVASGNGAHAEGYATTASGNYSHAEGGYSLAASVHCHAEGNRTTANSIHAHAEGSGSIASGQYSHAEGSGTTAYGNYSHAEGYKTSAYNYTHAEGESTSASGGASHAEGSHTLASDSSSHAEGSYTRASGSYAHAEGYCTSATNSFGCHSEGYYTKASGMSSHAEGYNTTASGGYAHAEGHFTTAYGKSSHAGGGYTIASNNASVSFGHYNAGMTGGGTDTNTTGTAFVIGNGTSDSDLSNAFSVQFDGIVKAKSTITGSTTADYAEFFEWEDGNPNKEDRVGKFVTLHGDKIAIATSNKDYILGIVSGEPFVLGNGDCDAWNGMYLKDSFNRTIYEPAPKMELDEKTGELKEVFDGDGNPVYEGTRPVLNPEYDPTKPYISRFDRAEWAPVGMLGVLSVIHDGTCKVNGYACCNSEGIARACNRTDPGAYRVIASVTDNICKVILK